YTCSSAYCVCVCVSLHTVCVCVPLHAVCAPLHTVCVCSSACCVCVFLCILCGDLYGSGLKPCTACQLLHQSKLPSVKPSNTCLLSLSLSLSLSLIHSLPLCLF